MPIVKSRAAVILLAAGASLRMGRAKLALPYGDSTLLRHAAETALASSCVPVIVVLGANADALNPLINDLGLHIVRNPAWSTGIAGSIAAGLNAAAMQASPDAAIIAVADQPAVTPALFDQLASCFEAHCAEIVASAYSGTLGTPALFAKPLFPELLSLRGTDGAKRVIMRHRESVLSIPFPGGELDIDSPEDYEAATRSAD